MNISIIHPSYGRPEMAFITAEKWLERAGCKVQYIMHVDAGDPLLLNYMEKRTKGVVLMVSDNHTAIEAINSAVPSTNGDLLIVVSDDFDCPKNWGVALKHMLRGKQDFLVKTPDSLQKTLITLPIMDRTYYNRFGYIYHPDYKHMFCDQEMTAVGHMLGKVVEVPLLFKHLHYSTGGIVKDHVSLKNDATWRQGEDLFNQRLKTNFGIENPVINYDQIIWH